MQNEHHHYCHYPKSITKKAAEAAGGGEGEQGETG